MACPGNGGMFRSVTTAKEGARPGAGDTVAERSEATAGVEVKVRAGVGASGVGEVVGSYRLEALLGSGGMGRVYRAKHLRLGREVALKLLLPQHVEDRVAVTRFFNEAHAVNAINHEHIVQIYDCVEEPPPSSRVFCILELLEGKTLSAAMKEGPLPLTRTLEIVRQVCEALAAAHRCGVVHRDVKPANIFLTHRADAADFVKVLDFGVAKMLRPLGGDRDELATVAGVAIGTPEYMSPEQALSKPVDERSDIYAVGLLLYELLSGRRPFDPGSLAQLLVALVTEPPKPLPGRTKASEAIPPVLAELTMRCLRKNPDERPRSMDEVRHVLTSLQQTGRAKPAAVRAEAKKTERELPRVGAPSKRAWWLLAPVGVLLVGVLFFALRHPSSAVRPPVARPLPIATPAAGAAATPLPTAKPTPGPKQVLLTVTSKPTGAEVRRADTGERLGATPLKRSFPDGTALTLGIQHPGYQEATRALVLSADAVVDVTLSPEPVPPKHRSGSRKEHPLERDAQLDPFASH